MKVAKWKLNAAPETQTSKKLRPERRFKLLLETANEIIPTAAISNLKKAREIADVSVANLTKMALEPKKMEEVKRIIGPVEDGNLNCILPQVCMP
jgi:hypothetical protein